MDELNVVVYKNDLKAPRSSSKIIALLEEALFTLLHYAVGRETDHQLQESRMTMHWVNACMHTHTHTHMRTHTHTHTCTLTRTRTHTHTSKKC